MNSTVLQNAVPPYHARILIDGRWIEGAEKIEVYNPALPDELVGTAVRGTSQDVQNAVEAARKAQLAWGRKSFTERAAILAKAIDLVESDIEERARLFVRENGKTLAEAKGELAGVVRRQRGVLDYASALDAPRELPAAQGKTKVLLRPYGVVVSIVPWNGPVSVAFTQMIAALLAGNSVVLKPPESCPLTLCRTMELFANGLPAGLVNLVTGLPSEIGDALTTHPHVGKIGFTGSIASARHIGANAAQTIKGVTLELGGNDPALLLPDVDLKEAVLDSMVAATLQMTGQVCMGIKRIYVHRSRSEEFVDGFAKAMNKTVVGYGLDPQVTLGPLHTRRSLERATGLIADAQERGAHVQRLGKIQDKSIFEAGYFMQPTLVSNVADDAPLMAEEQFCAAIPVTTYDDVEEAISRANDSVYGLSASVWSREPENAWKVAPSLAAGQVWINAHGPRYTNHKAPYGGVKQSGIGRKSGLEGILDYVQTQTLTSVEQA